ncbi:MULTISPECIES: DUF4190 domain-containing protein [Actinomadura]|uniref:DUF4190 domain-containing protein n=1 Tax=Actinomadura litoris TaxID=2678616 RepID=A0A7K1L7R4_9ACTN|nr:MULTISPECIES: DUF4190 domain-containing protein [Actinomadura]MBT2210519.1 hypothetical protein [Actinomadura sp. NEAU-AAG7]MUN40487.1 hypothetical protein [Actinomadura litoris]
MSDRQGQGSGGTAPAGRPPAERTGMRALWLGGLALLTTFFFFPLGFVLGIASLVVGIRAQRLARRASATAPGATAGIVLGSIGLAISLLAIVTAAYLARELDGFNKCLNGSNTVADRQACHDHYYPKMDEKLRLPKGTIEDLGVGL